MRRVSEGFSSPGSLCHNMVCPLPEVQRTAGSITWVSAGMVGNSGGVWQVGLDDLEVSCSLCDSVIVKLSHHSPGSWLWGHLLEQDAQGHSVSPIFVEAEACRTNGRSGRGGLVPAQLLTGVCFRRPCSGLFNCVGCGSLRCGFPLERASTRLLSSVLYTSSMLSSAAGGR